MQKRHLQIATNFLEQQDSSPQMPSFSKIDYEVKLDAVAKLEKSLSLMLARNFIECWKQLKVPQSAALRHKRSHRQPRRGGRPINCGHEEKGHSSAENDQPAKPRSHSQAFINIKTERSLYGQDEEYRIKRNKSTRAIAQEIENSRATILRDIVEKLKNARKPIYADEDEDRHIHQVFKRIAHLERMVRGIRNWSSHRVYKSYISYVHPPTEYKSRPQSPEWQTAAEEGQLVKQFMQQIQTIRKEITEIKANNQLILKAEIERSQLIEHEETKPKNSPETTKIMMTEGVQTVEKHPTFAEIEEKYKRLVEEASLFTKATPITHVNGSHLEASGTDSRESEKYPSCHSHRYFGLTQNFMPIKKNSPVGMPEPNIVNSNNNANGFLFKPSNVTVPIPSVRPAAYTPQPYTYPSVPSHSAGLSWSLPQQSQPQTSTIINKPSICFEYPKFQETKAATSYQNRSTMVESAPSVSSYTARSYNLSNPFLQPKNSNTDDNKPNITFTNYCSTCGRNCGCSPISFSDNHKF